MVSGTRVGWMVVGVVCVLTTLAVLAGPPTIESRAWRAMPPATTSPPTSRAEGAADRSAAAGDVPTVVRLEASEPLTIAPVPRTAGDEVELAGYVDSRQSAAAAQPQPRDPYAADRGSDRGGNRLLRALFPRGSKLIAPPQPELPPPSVSLPAEMGRLLR